MTPIVIHMSGLTKRYGPVTAVDGLSLDIRQGEIFGLLGPNGAGKSTTILMILGLTEPTAGWVRVCGIDPVVDPIPVKRRVGYLPDDVGFYDNRSGVENLIYTAQLNGLSRGEALTRASSLLTSVGLAADGGRRTGEYSRGMRQRLGLADVLIKQPDIIILDEPTLGIDPVGVREFLALIVRLSREQGITLLLSSHHLHQVQQVCDRVGLFVGGRLIAEGDVASLSARVFGSEPFLVEAGIAGDLGLESLEASLAGLSGVRSVERSARTLRIGCTADVSSSIARTVVESGYDLAFLQQHAHGLDDIYNRYFEKSLSHE